MSLPSKMTFDIRDLQDRRGTDRPSVISDVHLKGDGPLGDYIDCVSRFGKMHLNCGEDHLFPGCPRLFEKSSRAPEMQAAFAVLVRQQMQRSHCLDHPHTEL